MAELKQGKARLRWMPGKQGGYVGTVLLNGKRLDPIEDEDEAQLIVRLRNEAGRLHPDYFGIDGALSRFREFMPDGFASADNERLYKVRAADRLQAALPLELASDAGAAEAAAIAQASVLIGILAPQEAARLKDTLLGNSGARYLRGAASFTNGDLGKGIDEMTAAVTPHGRISWPLITFLPFLWDASRHMFLKPEVTRDFASRVGHFFCDTYAAQPAPQTYRDLLDLVGWTRTRIVHLAPRDNIDIQSFIWVVGKYVESDKARP